MIAVESDGREEESCGAELASTVGRFCRLVRVPGPSRVARGAGDSGGPGRALMAVKEHLQGDPGLRGIGCAGCCTPRRPGRPPRRGRPRGPWPPLPSRTRAGRSPVHRYRHRPPRCSSRWRSPPRGRGRRTADDPLDLRPRRPGRPRRRTAAHPVVRGAGDPGRHPADPVHTRPTSPWSRWTRSRPTTCSALPGAERPVAADPAPGRVLRPHPAGGRRHRRLHRQLVLRLDGGLDPAALHRAAATLAGAATPGCVPPSSSAREAARTSRAGRCGARLGRDRSALHGRR